jgi:micrococcal nuclease
MTETTGTTVKATVVRVVDGDTIVTALEGVSESLRLLALDTEESRAGGTKPKTPWGLEAKAEAQRFFPAGADVTLEFPGGEPLNECLVRYRDNFGRLLVLVHLHGVDYSEHMIREGYSPYFVKYGAVALPEQHARYVTAERRAQGEGLGVWDQLAVNGSEVRNYAVLGTWWALRAGIIDGYRRARDADPSLLNSRLDYAQISALAEQRADATVFTELRGVTRTADGRHAVVDIGSPAQPFKLFVPEIDADAGRSVLALIANRYLPGDDRHPRRSYAYVRGPLQLFRGRPQQRVSDPAQIADTPPSG